MSDRTLLDKLRSPDGKASLERLAQLVVDDLLAQRVSNTVTTTAVAQHLRALLTSWLESPEAEATLSRLVEQVVQHLQRERRALKERIAPEVVSFTRQVLSRPLSLDRSMVLSFIDRGPIRELVRSILLEEILEFGRRASAPVAGVARGLGALARMAQDTVKSRTGGLGSLVGAVGTEVERQLERRAADFVDAALGNVFAQVADVFCDPRRAEEAIELRRAVFDAVLELTGPQLARELVNADVPGAVSLARSALRAWLETARSEPALVELAAFVFSFEDGSLGDLLQRFGVLAPVRALLVEQAVTRLMSVVATPGFAQWLAALEGA